MKTQSINILGSTGSIGTQTLEVCRERGIKVNGISANSNIDLLERQAREFKVKFCHINNKELLSELKIRLKDTSVTVTGGEDGLCDFAVSGDADTLLTSVVGSVGLAPTVAGIKNKMKIALANKETLVAAGELVTAYKEKYGGEIIPVDSEHGAIFQALMGNDIKKVRRLILTASGGPFFGRNKAELKNVTKKDALKHPNWEMGAKITIDSATLMNKGFEVIEARWLFGITDIDVVVHRESVVHSMVEYEDRSVIAQMGVPSMKLPIQFALTYPEREESTVEPLDFKKYPRLTFYEPDLETFGCLRLALESMKKGGTMPLCLNAANEVAVEYFLKEKIGFTDIERTVEEMLTRHKSLTGLSLEDTLRLDRELKEETKKYLEELS
ncbi:MAG: 1-deoxy-D-xylulose-5-phosphate reductoisomerase [Ruminococcaceae bacterium]|nr:1-deoxy-D-xylulose-5-phosphate reductoisomerase [Oscillospiraceae bacterium]